jgi:hypothetical protein
LLKSAKKVWMFVAYLGNTGMDEIFEALRTACDRSLDFELYCGLSQCVTNPDALLRVLKIFGKAKAARLYLWNQQQTFHPKVYCFFSEDDVTFVVGSANLTGGGMKNNLEVSAIQTVPLDSDAARAMENLRSEIVGVAEPATILGISQYRRKYKIYRKRRDKAEKEAKKEISKIRDLKLNEIKSCLNQYHKDGKDQDFPKRQVQYEQARKVLDRLADTSHLGKSSFVELYSKLVGGGNKHGLWTSSGVARSKGQVVHHYRKVLSLIRVIRSNSGEPPEALFKIGKKRIETIRGFGVNLLTEVMHTFGPDRFAVLNKRPLTALKKFGCDPFPTPGSFEAEVYGQFNDIVAEVKNECSLQSMAQADHFLSYVYSEDKKERKRRQQKL